MAQCGLRRTASQSGSELIGRKYTERASYQQQLLESACGDQSEEDAAIEATKDPRKSAEGFAERGGASSAREEAGWECRLDRCATAVRRLAGRGQDGVREAESNRGNSRDSESDPPEH